MSARAAAAPADVRTLKVERINGSQFAITNNLRAIKDWDREYVEFSGFAGVLGAELFATAPEMLDLLYQYVSDLRYPPTGDSIQRRIERAEAVIAKATAGAR